ncbi:ABC transporter permease [Nocardioides sp. KR10-350]|uniref:ABC transporter permease n=1 Tax=Nocardioides cheoyonin TaxID=3156615 RepID=UPI0032B3C2DB
MTDTATAVPAPTPTAPARSAPVGGAWVRWVLRRIGLAVLTLWLVSLLVFAATTALGDPVRAILGRDYEASPGRVAQLREQLHLDWSWPHRYLDWLGGLFTGDLGTSVSNNLPVSSLIGDRIVNSAVLVAAAAIVAIPVSFGVALLCARFRQGKLDQGVQVGLLGLAALPEFVIGILLVALLSTTVLHWFPAVTISEGGSAPWHHPVSMVLPVITLVLAVAPYIIRILRATLLEVLDSDYVELARLKGVPERVVLRRHALLNAVVPGIQVIALQLAWLAGGVVIVEYLFSYPGIGASLVDSVTNSDFPMVQALSMVIAAVYVVVNLVADVLAILFTPKARTEISS